MNIEYYDFNINKENDLQDFFNSFNRNIFIETGTSEGRTFEYLLKNSNFKIIKSVELLENLQKKNYLKFSQIQKSYPDKIIKLYTGMSYLILSSMLEDVVESSVIFLDAHPSGINSGGHKERYDNGNMKFDGYYIVEEELKVILTYCKNIKFSNIKYPIIIIDDIDKDFAEGKIMNIFSEYNMKENYKFYLTNEGNVSNGRKDKLLICTNIFLNYDSS